MDPKRQSPGFPARGPQFVDYGSPSSVPPPISPPSAPPPSPTPVGRQETFPDQTGFPPAPSSEITPPILPTTPFADVSPVAPAPTAPETSVPPSPILPVMPVPPPQPSFTPPQPPPLPSVPPPPFSPQYPYPSMPEHRSHKLAIAAIVAVLFIAAAGAYAAYIAMMPPDQVLSAALSNMDSSSKIEYEATLALDSDNPAVGSSTVAIGSLIDRSDAGDKKAQVTFDVSSASTSVGAEIRLVNNILYAQLTGVPAAYESYVAQFMDKWYSLPIQTLKTLGASYGAPTTAINDVPTLSGSFAKLRSASVIGGISFSGLSIDSQRPSRVYDVSIDKTSLAFLIVDSLKAATSSSYQAESNAYAEDMFKSLVISPVSVHIDLFSGQLRSVSGNVSVLYESTSTAAANGNYSLQYSIIFENPGQNDTVDIPQGATDLGSMITSSLNSAQSQGKNARIQSDVLQARTSMETYQSPASGYSGGCTNVQGMNVLENDVYANGSSLYCRDSSKAYIIYAAMPSAQTTSAVSFYCADSTGRTATLPKMPAGYVCQ